jgi:hypothetical protein
MAIIEWGYDCFRHVLGPTTDCNGVCGWIVIRMRDRITEVSHKELECLALPLLIEGDIEQSSIQRLLDHILHWVHSDILDHPTIVPLVESCRDWSTVLLLGVVKSKVDICYKSMTLLAYLYAFYWVLQGHCYFTVVIVDLWCWEEGVCVEVLVYVDFV